MKKREALKIEEFEILLNERLQHVQKNIEELKEELSDVGSDDTMNDMEDLASLKALNDSDNTLLHHQEEELKEIYHALAKIKNRTYGICEETGKPIPVERLRANPIARYLVNVEK